MTPDEKLTRAEALKEQGNATLKAGQLKHARTKYLKAMRILDQTFDFQGDYQVSASMQWCMLLYQTLACSAQALPVTTTMACLGLAIRFKVERDLSMLYALESNASLELTLTDSLSEEWPNDDAGGPQVPWHS